MAILLGVCAALAKMNLRLGSSFAQFMICHTHHARVHIAAFDLNLLLAFEALWIERHVTRAARRIGLTQSALSHALGRLRAQLEDPLFQRTPHGLVPTARAHELAHPIGEALALVRRAVEDGPRFSPATLQRTFTVSTTDYGELVILPALMARLAREAPGVQLNVRPTVGLGERDLLSGAHDLLSASGAPKATASAARCCSRIASRRSCAPAIQRRGAGSRSSASAPCRTCSCRHRATAPPSSTRRCARAS